MVRIECIRGLHPKTQGCPGYPSSDAQFHITRCAASPYLLDFTVGLTFGERQKIESVIPPDLQPKNLVAEMQRALVDEIDWQTLWSAGCHAYTIHEYVRGCRLRIGAVGKAPTSHSLYLQVSLAKNLEGFFKSLQSLYREIVSPFSVAYWEKTTAESTGLFRTAQAHT